MAGRTTAALTAAVAAAFLAVPGTAGAGPAVTLVSDTVLDPQALFFVSYDGVVNNNSFQQDAITTFNGYQYATWYTASRNAVVARRPLNGAWQTVVLGHKLTANDSHNVVSIGISPLDGTIHIALDTHNNRVYYYKSVAGLATSPGATSWTADKFGAEQRTLGGTELGTMTYPQFVVTPEKVLQFSYRTGGSGNGTNELAEYRNGAWAKLGVWSSATGTYTGPNGVASTTRNMYLHGLDYDARGRLHAAFTWREGNYGVLCNPGGISNHDTGYVYSDDRGRTWRNNAGAVVGTTGGTRVSITSPGLVVDPLDPNHALMNQESALADSTGTPHIVISYVPGRFGQCVSNYASQRNQYARTFHVTRKSDGTWTKREVPVPPNSTQRTKLVFDRNDSAYLVMPKGKIVSATKSSGWTDWTTVFDGASLRAFGEVNIDTSRVPVDGVLSVQYQQASSGTTPSPIRVADFRLG